MKYNPDKYTPPFRVGKKQRRAVLDGTGREVLLFHRGDEMMATAYCDYLNNEYWKVKRSTEKHIPKIVFDDDDCNEVKLPYLGTIYEDEK